MCCIPRPSPHRKVGEASAMILDLDPLARVKVALARVRVALARIALVRVSLDRVVLVRVALAWIVLASVFRTCVVASFARGPYIRKFQAFRDA